MHISLNSCSLPRRREGCQKTRLRQRFSLRQQERLKRNIHRSRGPRRRICSPSRLAGIRYFFLFLFALLCTNQNSIKLKKSYRTVRDLRNTSGFGWDDENQIVTADSAAWEEYIAAHPEAKPFRTKPFPLYDNLQAICQAIIATGDAAFNPGQRRSRKDSTSSVAGSDSEEEDGPPPSLSTGAIRKKSRVSSSAVSNTDADTGISATSGPARRKRPSAHSAFGSVAISLDRLVDVISDEHHGIGLTAAAPAAVQVAREQDPLAQAIAILEADVELPTEDAAIAIDLFVANVGTARAYAAIHLDEIRKFWIRRKIADQRASAK